MARATVSSSLAGSLRVRPDLLLPTMRNGVRDVLYKGLTGEGDLGFLCGLAADGATVSSFRPKSVSKKAGLRRSIETVSCLPPRSREKYFADRSSTRNGPSLSGYGGHHGEQTQRYSSAILRAHVRHVVCDEMSPVVTIPPWWYVDV